MGLIVEEKEQEVLKIKSAIYDAIRKINEHQQLIKIIQQDIGDLENQLRKLDKAK